MAQRPTQPMAFQRPRQLGQAMPAQLSPARFRYQLDVCNTTSASTDAQITQNLTPITRGITQSPIPTNTFPSARVQNAQNPVQTSPTPQTTQNTSVLSELKDLTSILAAATPGEQKQILGERLYPKVQALCPEFVPKITGMLLEIDNPELIHMLQHEAALMEKVRFYFTSIFTLVSIT